jgi:hypothetical protein
VYTEKTDIQWQLVTSTVTTVATGVIIAGKLIKNLITGTGVGA